MSNYIYESDVAGTRCRRDGVVVRMSQGRSCCHVRTKTGEPDTVHLFLFMPLKFFPLILPLKLYYSENSCPLMTNCPLVTAITALMQ